MNALIEHLRAMYVANGTNYVQAAADKLEAQAERIKELETIIQNQIVKDISKKPCHK